MKSFLIILCLQFFVVLGSSAQSVLAASGNNAVGTGGSVSYSIGQTVYSTVSGTNGTVSQGVQQPIEISVVTGIQDATAIILEIYVYPNPATDFVKLVIENYEIDDLSYQLSNIDGKLLHMRKIESNETLIPLDNFLSGVYFLRITDAKGDIKVFKIIKSYHK
jgi:hypothetical protein